MEKTYLGDGVYAAIDPHTGDIVLTTENGVVTTNTIVLEQPVWQNLLAWLMRRK